MNQTTPYSTPTGWDGYQEAAVAFAAALMQSGQVIEKDLIALGCDYADRMASALHVRWLRDNNPRTAILFYDSPGQWLRAVAGPQRNDPTARLSPELTFLWRLAEKGRELGSFAELAHRIEQMPMDEVACINGYGDPKELALNEFRTRIVALVRSQYPILAAANEGDHDARSTHS